MERGEGNKGTIKRVMIQGVAHALFPEYAPRALASSWSRGTAAVRGEQAGREGAGERTRKSLRLWEVTYGTVKLNMHVNAGG